MHSQHQKNTKNDWRNVLFLGSGIGFMLAAPLVISTIVGVWVDKRLETFPIVMIISVIFGFVLTGFEFYKIVIPFLEKRSDLKK